MSLDAIPGMSDSMTLDEIRVYCESEQIKGREYINADVILGMIRNREAWRDVELRLELNKKLSHL